MKKVTALLFLLLPIIGFSQLDIVITTNYVPLYPSDGDTLSVCRGDTVFFEAEVTDGGVPVTNAEYFWDFDDGAPITGIDTFSVYHIYKDVLGEDYQGGGGYRVKLKVVDAGMQTGFTILPIKVAIPPIYLGTEVVLPEGQIGICKGSPTTLFGKAYPDIWEDEPVYERIEDNAIPFDDVVPYSSSIPFDEFALGSTYASGDIDSIGLSIQHSNMGNLRVTLTCEAGNSVMLKDYDPTNHGTLGDTVSGEPYLYFWKETSPNGLMNNNTEDTIPEGTYQSEQSFDNFIGCSLNGSWTITIEDNQPVDSGFVYSWSVGFHEDVRPDIWTFKDTLVQYKEINSVIYGTWWHGVNVEATAVQVIGDTITGTTIAAPYAEGPNGYVFHVINNFGCPQDTSINLRVEELLITIKENPVFALIKPAEFKTTTSWITNNSWDFGDGETGENQDTSFISHVYEEPKDPYTVILISSDEFGCEDTDTAYITVNVEPHELKEVPNMFSPNGDDINDIWYFQEGNLQGMDEFLLTIYNRWGEIVFRTEHMEDVISPNGWNGQVRLGTANNKGLKAKGGIYFYVIRASSKDGKTEFGGREKKIKPGEESNQIIDGTKGTIHLFRGKEEQ